MKYVILVCFASLILSSCASYQAPKEYTIEKERTIQKSFEASWAAAVEWFAVHGTPVKNMDKSSGFIATDYNLSTQNYPQYCDCGSGGQGLVSKIITHPIGNFNILVKKIDDASTHLIITANFKAQLETRNVENELKGIEDLTCNSTGALEKEMLDYISK